MIFSLTFDLRLSGILLAARMTGWFDIIFHMQRDLPSFKFPEPEYRLLYVLLCSGFSDSDPTTSLGSPILRTSNFSEVSPQAMKHLSCQ